MSTYDDWKLATPPEYERDESGAPAAGSPEEPPNHRCASWICLACGACELCGDKHEEDCEANMPAHLREDLPPPLEDPEDGSPV